MGTRDWITAQLAAFLSQPLKRYERRGWSDPESLARTIRKGDVLLVEGDQRVSAVIRYLTQSSWSHAALYVGDELLRCGEPLRERTLESFGDDARHMLVEALLDGVVVSPLRKYAHLNVRLCRPHGLRPGDLRVILDDALSAIGWRYDLRNVLDLAAHLVFVSLMGRASGGSSSVVLGSGAPTEVMCTSLLGRLFHRVGFPVLPEVDARVLRRRHPTLLQPRDFDLSPYFEIVKVHHGGARGFDYQRITWADGSGEEVA
jgi:hypothetical protein